MNCSYCAIAAGKGDAHILVQDDRSVCFLDPSPMTTGHAVIIPKAHAQDIYEIEEADWDAVCNTIRVVATLLKAEVGTDSINIFHGSGPHASERAPHLAVHLVPRKPGDGLDHLGSPHHGSRSPTNK